ncbi:MAG: hypothetical protein WKF96_08590 [Solirubrobacteraceae bacterium]
MVGEPPLAGVLLPAPPAASGLRHVQLKASIDRRMDRAPPAIVPRRREHDYAACRTRLLERLIEHV